MNNHYKLKKIIVNKNHPNILLYNNYSLIYCKKLIINILNDLYNINNITNKITYKNIDYEKSLYHYYIDINKIKDFSTFKNLINKIIQSDNYYISYNKLIILDNFKFNINNQKTIKNLIEKHMNIKFIIIVSNYNTILNNLKNICVCIKIPSEKLNINYINNNILYNNDLYSDLTNKINAILLVKLNKKSIKDIKNFSYLLLLNNIKLTNLYTIIIDILIQKNVVYDIIIKINQFFDKILNYKNINLNIILIYYEYIFIKCNTIINN
tara:strand:- start:206 stop:1006 length:801 start_codon:yes stop_codon:yes gene_type:complete